MNRPRPPHAADLDERLRRDFAQLTAVLEVAHGHAVRGQARDLPPGQRRAVIARLQRSLAAAAGILSRVAEAGRRRADA